MKTIEQWAKEEKERIDRFMDSYLNGAIQNPEMFPTILPEGANGTNNTDHTTNER